MKKKFLMMLFCLIISLMYYAPNANANEISETSTTLAADTITAGVTIQYSMKSYCTNYINCTSGKTLVPSQTWVERSGGYAGYIPIDSYYESPTHFVVTYWGTIKKGPYVENIIKEN